jgi:hypothetical protein
LKPDDWFVLCVNSPAKNGVILNAIVAERACREFDGQLLESMTDEGFTPVVDGEGNWIAWELNEGVLPYSVPKPIKHLAKYVDNGTVVWFDSCAPSVEWRFYDNEVEVVDSYIGPQDVDA